MSWPCGAAAAAALVVGASGIFLSVYGNGSRPAPRPGVEETSTQDDVQLVSELSAKLDAAQRAMDSGDRAAAERIVREVRERLGDLEGRKPLESLTSRVEIIERRVVEETPGDQPGVDSTVTPVVPDPTATGTPTAEPGGPEETEPSGPPSGGGSTPAPTPTDGNPAPSVDPSGNPSPTSPVTTAPPITSTSPQSSAPSTNQSTRPTTSPGTSVHQSSVSKLPNDGGTASS